MVIVLTKSELDYMHSAINAWVSEAKKYMNQLAINAGKYYKEDDFYDPFRPAKCFQLTGMQVQDAAKLKAKMDHDWSNNGGQIDLGFFKNKLLKFSIHPNDEAPELLSIQKKYIQG